MYNQCFQFDVSPNGDFLGLETEVKKTRMFSLLKSSEHPGSDALEGLLPD